MSESINPLSRGISSAAHTLLNDAALTAVEARCEGYTIRMRRVDGSGGVNLTAQIFPTTRLGHGGAVDWPLTPIRDRSKPRRLSRPLVGERVTPRPRKRPKA